MEAVRTKACQRSCNIKLTLYLGICAEFVNRAADLGAKGVVVADVALTDRAQKIVDSYKNVFYQKTDVAKWDQLQKMVDVAKEQFGSTPDVYIAGAGVFEPVRP